MTFYTTNDDGSITASADFKFADDAVETDREIVRGHDGKLYFVDEVPERPQEIVLQELQSTFTDAIQQRLDAFARTRNYDGILSAASYATSTIPQFKAEGQCAVEARDATWAVGYAILADVLSGQRPMPTIEEVFAELPVLEWPT